MARYGLTKPQPFLSIAFPEIRIQTVRMAGYKNCSAHTKREQVLQTPVLYWKWDCQGEQERGRTKQDAISSMRTRLKDSLVEIRFCPKYRQLCLFSDATTQKGSKHPLSLPATPKCHTRKATLPWSSRLNRQIRRRPRPTD